MPAYEPNVMIVDDDTDAGAHMADLSGPHVAEAAHRVLIVEDDFDTRAALINILELDGHDVVGVGTAEESLRQDGLNEYTTIILERRLPDGNADELLPKLQALAPDAAFIIATGFADLNGAISAFRAGVYDYLLKPINPELLRASLSRLTQLRQAEQRALRMERLAAIGQMVTAVAHESRNALQRIQAGAELMRLSLEDRPDLLADLDGIVRANDGLRSLFDELREFAAPIVLDRKDMNVATSIELAWESLRYNSAHTTATFQVDSKLASNMCPIDSFRIEQVFRNLFENALGATPCPANVIVTLSSVNRQGRNAVLIVVRDNGPGFTEEQRQKAFEPFFTTKSKGTGLGLAISKRIVDAHDGCIEISASRSEGGEVRVCLPRSIGSGAKMRCSERFS